MHKFIVQKVLTFSRHCGKMGIVHSDDPFVMPNLNIRAPLKIPHAENRRNLFHDISQNGAEPFAF